MTLHTVTNRGNSNLSGKGVLTAMETGQFYCVGCQELKDAVFSHRVFRTGYFRIVYPLGCCLVCHNEARSDAAIDGSGTVFEPLDAESRTSSAAMPENIGPSTVRQAAV